METQKNTQNTGDKPIEGTISFSWSAPTIANHDRSSRWYLFAAIFVLGCVVWSILTGNWSFALVILLTGGMYFLMRNVPAPLRTISITEQGFSFEGLFTPWTDCKDFWIIRTPTYSELHIEKKKTIRREVVIQTGEVPPEFLEELLSRFLTHRSDQKERLLDIFIRLFKL